MMRLWSFIIILFLSIGFGLMIYNDPGYSLFAYNNWTVEMPLWLTLIFLILIVTLTIMLLSIFNFLFSTRKNISSWFDRRRRNKARFHTTKGLLELTAGQFSAAEKHLTKSAPYSDEPLINYLSAAKAAEAKGDTGKRDLYLQKGLESKPDALLIVRLTEAKLEMQHGDINKSIPLLEKLLEENPKNPEILRSLIICYEKKEDWPSLFMLLPSIKKVKLYQNIDEELHFERKTYCGIMYHFKDTKENLMKFWKSAPRSITSYPKCILVYANLLHQMSADVEAERLLRDYLKKNSNDELLNLYGLLKGESPQKQLSFAESLLEKDQENPVLFLTLGRLALNNQLWGKARNYLEQHLTLKPSVEGYALIGQLMDRLHEPKKRDEYFKKGLEFALKNNS